jgi:hypothetical protein
VSALDDIYTIDDIDGPVYRVEVRFTRYNPVQRAKQYSVEVFDIATGRRIGSGTVNSWKRSYTSSKAQDIIERWS